MPMRSIAKRSLVLSFISICLHFIVVNWAGTYLHKVGTSQPLETTLLQTVQVDIRPLTTTPPESRQQAKPPAKPKTVRKSPPPAAPIIEKQTVDTHIEPAIPPTTNTATTESSAPSSENVASSDTQVAATNKPIPNTDADDAAEKATTAIPHYKVQAPPSVTLQYDVQAWRGEQTLYGSSKMRWQTDGATYQLDGDTSVLFLNFLTFKSQGVIDEYGISPVLYNEKRWRKAETNTHFHRERNIISFSASTITYPRQGGEQDRASVIWQLAGIGRGDAEKFQAGKEITIFLAGVRDAEMWNFRVVGLEQIDITSGKISAWHITRTPRPGSYDQGLEIWLAPQQEWYPVKLRYTETNGDHLDMVATSITPTKASAGQSH